MGEGVGCGEADACGCERLVLEWMEDAYSFCAVVWSRTTAGDQDNFAFETELGAKRRDGCVGFGVIGLGGTGQAEHGVHGGGVDGCQWTLELCRRDGCSGLEKAMYRHLCGMRDRWNTRGHVERTVRYLYPALIDESKAIQGLS